MSGGRSSARRPLPALPPASSAAHTGAAGRPKTLGLCCSPHTARCEPAVEQAPPQARRRSTSLETSPPHTQPPSSS